MGIKIKTDDKGVKVWRSDKYQYPQYSVMIWHDTDDGERVTEYKQLQFRKGVELANQDEIIINDAFPTLRIWKDKQTGELKHREVWMVLDFSFKTGEPPVQQELTPVTASEAATLFDDLPDSFSAAEDEIPF